MSEIVLIDDDESVLTGLREATAKHLPEASIAAWQPVREDNVEEKFRQLVVDGETVLVATDQDLTSGGLRGFFGPTIVNWCQQLAIPVGDFSRRTPELLPHAGDLFELRIPPNDEDGAQYIAAIYRGFTELTEIISSLALDPSGTSLAKYLSYALERPYLESDFALYMARMGTSGTSVAARIIGSQRSIPGLEARPPEVAISYTLGHYMANIITRFAGPLLSIDALCSYVAVGLEERSALVGLFERASYSGPFSGLDQLFWRDTVDEIIDELDDDALIPLDDMGANRRAILENSLDRSMARHICQREDCEGSLGGFHCPFEDRPVCIRSDCSVAGSSWIPDGATSSRIEREYHDEWAPLLGQ